MAIFKSNFTMTIYQKIRPAMLSLFLLTLFISSSLSSAVKADNTNNNETGNDTTSTSSSIKNCVLLNPVMLEQNNACRCFDNPSFIVNSDPSYTDDDDDQRGEKIGSSTKDEQLSWIGCSREKMPAIFKALTSLPNETNLTQLWIWDSLIPMMPAKIFNKVRPKKLIIERCHTGSFTLNDIFAPLADRLTELELKNNILTDIRAELLSPLRRLIRLDLSVNLLTQITNVTFGKSVPNLRSLSLYRNQLSQITDDALDNLRQLRSLNLASNRLTRITASTFKNLQLLEYLNLENNRLVEIDEKAFSQLTRLRVLNLGGNRLTIIHFPVVYPQLRQLFLNNNTFQNMDDIRTIGGQDSMTNLQTLHLDQNQLKTLESKNQGGFKRWPSLQVISLASNELTTLKTSDFEGLQKLRTLSLQGNRLAQLDDGVFTNLLTLEELFLSQNQLTHLGERTFDGLMELRILTVARNRLATIDKKTFNGLKRLEKLFLNDNYLKYLSNTTFDVVQTTLSIIDLSDNVWLCDCELLWLTKWVAERENTILIDSRQTQCADQQQNDHYSHSTNRILSDIFDDLTKSCQNEIGGDGIQSNRNPYGGGGGGLWDTNTLIQTSNNVWITVLGIVLGVVSIFILLAVSYLYFQDTNKKGASNGNVWRIGDGGGVTSSVFGRWTASGVVLRSEHALRRVPSDMVNLIPKCSTNNSSSAASTTGEKM